MKLKAVRSKSKIEHNPTIALKEEREDHIEFDYESEVEYQKLLTFQDLILDELALRLKDKPQEMRKIAVASLDERVVALKELMKTEQEIWKAQGTMDRLAHSKWFTAEQAIPCNLHLVCRVMEKIFYQFLSECLNKYKEGDNARVRVAFVKATTLHMNTVVLGTKQNPAQWTFPLKDNKGGGKTVEKRNMTGGTAKKCIAGLKYLAIIAYSPQFDQASLDPKLLRSENETWATTWHDIMDIFIPLMDLLERKEDFTEEMIMDFHCLCAQFVHKYCDMFQGEGITNYIHLIGAGHLTYYLRKYRNLTKFCQQGWEALNQLLKQYYFNNTNHGGCNGNSKGKMEKFKHCLPLVKLCQRRTMWLLGLGEKIFENKMKLQKVVEEERFEEDEDAWNVL